MRRSSSVQPSKRGLSGTRQPRDASHWLGSKNQSYYHYVAIIRLENTPTLPIQSLDLITQHQVQPIKNLLPHFDTEKGICLICKTSQRTACVACKQVYYYTWCSQYLHEILLQYTTTSTFQAEGEQSYPSILNRIQEYYQQRTSCQTMIAMTVNSTPQVMIISESMLGLTLLLPA